MEQKSETTLKGYFSKTSLEQIAPRPTTGTIHVWQDVDVVAVQEDEKCSRVFNKLVVEGFLSVPCLDARKQYLSTIDMLDVGALVLRCMGSDGVFNETQFLEARAASLIQEHKKLHADAELVVEKATLNVWQALQRFAESPRLHRIVSLSNKRIAGYLTQSMLISLMAQHTTDSDLKRALQTKISAVSASAAKEELLTLKEEQTMLDALKVLVSKNISGAGIVDKSGALCDQISIRDLRGLGSNCGKWKRLTLSLKEYRALLKIEFPEQTPRDVLHVTGEQTLLDVLANLDDGNIHRVWICEKAAAESSGAAAGAASAKLQAKAVITQGDFIRIVHQIMADTAARASSAPATATATAPATAAAGKEAAATPAAAPAAASTAGTGAQSSSAAAASTTSTTSGGIA